MNKSKDLTGKKFGRLTVIKKIRDNKKYKWLCECECGKTKNIIGWNLVNNMTKSCGCLGREIRILALTKHGMTKSVEFTTWHEMKRRCLGKDKKRIKNYGDRGITVCDRWLKFENFYKDMGKRPTKKHSIDRIDNSKGYSKDNCRWATSKQQGRNKRNNIMVTYKGETKCLSEWAEVTGLKQALLYQRTIRDNLEPHKIFSKTDLRFNSK